MQNCDERSCDEQRCDERSSDEQRCGEQRCGETRLYPLTFAPIIKTMIWGQESWDISCRPLEMGVVENGPLAGKEFSKVVRKFGADALGRGISPDAAFPMLVKIIDARDILSVQVHPTDAYAKQLGAVDTGKSEAWYVLQPPTAGHILLGTKQGVTKHDFVQHTINGKIEECLQHVNVNTGDVINIPAGLIHALTPGIVVAEVQQNSDITFRLHDFGRRGPDGKPRQTHAFDGIWAADFFGANAEDFITRAEDNPPSEPGKNTTKTVVDGEHFTLTLHEITSQQNINTCNDAFLVLTCVGGEAEVVTQDYRLSLTKHRSAFIPAALRDIRIHPNRSAKILCAKPRTSQPR